MATNCLGPYNAHEYALHYYSPLSLSPVLSCLFCLLQGSNTAAPLHDTVSSGAASNHVTTSKIPPVQLPTRPVNTMWITVWSAHAFSHPTPCVLELPSGKVNLLWVYQCSCFLPTILNSEAAFGQPQSHVHCTMFSYVHYDISPFQ